VRFQTPIILEQQFGPVLPIIAYADLDEVVERANATHFGLSGSVRGADGDRAVEIAARLDCGTAWVNTHLTLKPNQLVGGAKWSGIGVENGPWGLYGFTGTASPSTVPNPEGGRKPVPSVSTGILTLLDSHPDLRTGGHRRPRGEGWAGLCRRLCAQECRPPRAG
jgi:hypothetical protein